MPIIAWLLGVPLTVVLLLMLLGVFWDPGVSHPHPRGNRRTCHGFAGFALGRLSGGAMFKRKKSGRKARWMRKKRKRSGWL